MFDSIGGGEIILILIAILVLFGPKRIPDLAQSLGKGLREFRKAQQDLQNNLTKVVNQEDLHNITSSIRGIQQDMQSSMQKLSGDVAAAAEASKPAAAAPAAAAPAAAALPAAPAASPSAPPASSAPAA